MATFIIHPSSSEAATAHQKFSPIHHFSEPKATAASASLHLASSLSVSLSWR